MQFPGFDLGLVHSASRPFLYVHSPPQHTHIHSFPDDNGVTGVSVLRSLFSDNDSESDSDLADLLHEKVAQVSVP